MRHEPYVEGIEQGAERGIIEHRDRQTGTV